MYDFLFRFDANERVGAGHFQRALALIQILSSRGYSVACCGDYTEDYQYRLGRQNLSFFPVDSALQARCLVFDYYGDFDDFIASGVSFKAMVVFEDLSARGHSRADLVINAFGDPEDLGSRYPRAQVLCGVEYLVFREHLNTLKKNASYQPAVRHQKSVLVSLGGTDQSAVLTRVLSVICDLLDPDIQIKVLSPVNLTVPDRCLLHVGLVDNFLERALASDLIICGLGQSFLEMQALGKACIGLMLAENQSACAKSLAEYQLNIIQNITALESSLAEYLQAEFSEFLASGSRVYPSESWRETKMTGSQRLILEDKLGSEKECLIDRMVALLV